MQLTRCPICHCRIHLEALVQDDAGRGLLAVLGKLESSMGTALIAYLGLFRPANRDLANDRALRLAKEVLELTPSSALTYAMAHTLESMRAKQSTGQFKPLSNHNYLKRVLEDAPTTVIEAVTSISTPLVKSHKDTRRAITESIMNVNDTNW